MRSTKARQRLPGLLSGAALLLASVAITVGCISTAELLGGSDDDKDATALKWSAAPGGPGDHNGNRGPSTPPGAPSTGSRGGGRGDDDNRNDNSDNGNANDNTDNGNDNNGNENDNADDNRNDNTDNGNDNTDDNGNDNEAPPCPDGNYRVRTELGGEATGEMEYRELVAGCKRFRVSVEGLAPNATFDVVINTTAVGQILTDSKGRGELEFDTEDGNFPASFPRVNVGDVGFVDRSFGEFSLDCPGSQTCS
jgi:hypothetical protein